MIAWLFSACSTIEYIGIETYNPAEVTFPKSVKNVLVVNNALPQPDSLGYTYLVPGVTNQIFPILPDALLEALAKDFSFSEQERVDPHHRAVRFCTSWATTEENVTSLCQAIVKYSK